MYHLKNRNERKTALVMPGPIEGERSTSKQLVHSRICTRVQASEAGTVMSTLLRVSPVGVVSEEICHSMYRQHCTTLQDKRRADSKCHAILESC